MDQWNMGVTSKLVEIEGRQLQPEIIIQGGRGIAHEVGRNADWTQGIRGKSAIACSFISHL